MKAKEYVKKYSNDISIDPKKAVIQIITELSKEGELLFEKRHVTTEAGLINTLTQQNDKWNAICRLISSKTEHSEEFKEDLFLSIARESCYEHGVDFDRYLPRKERVYKPCESTSNAPSLNLEK